MVYKPPHCAFTFRAFPIQRVESYTGSGAERAPGLAGRQLAAVREWRAGTLIIRAAG